MAYDIEFLKADGTYGALSTCNGYDSTIVTNRGCTVTMSDVLTLTSLPVDSLIRIKIRALNGINWGDFSQLNTNGPTIETIPA